MPLSDALALESETLGNRQAKSHLVCNTYIFFFNGKKKRAKGGLAGRRKQRRKRGEKEEESGYRNRILILVIYNK